MKIIYVCAPYRGTAEHSREENVKRVKNIGRKLIMNGYVPFIAHIAICPLLDDDIPEEREAGIRTDIEMLRHCDELWVFGNNITEGMRMEIREAQRTGIPVKYVTEYDGTS